MIRAQIHQICDRCSKAFSLVQFDIADGLPEIPKREPIEVRRGDEVIARFEDLCEDCDRVAEKLVARLTLEKSARERGKVGPEGGEASQEADNEGPTDSSDAAIGGGVEEPDPKGSGGVEEPPLTSSDEKTEDAVPADQNAPNANDESLAKSSEQVDGHEF